MLAEVFWKEEIMSLQVVQLLDLLKEVGKEDIEKFLADFSCSKNKDVEFFLRKKAIPYENSNKGRTYLVLEINEEDMYLVAYFTLASLPIIFDEKVGKKRRKEILGTGYENNGQLSGNLIGQIGKNFAVKDGTLITGEALFDLALHKVILANKLIGGRIVYLECEDNEILKRFYSNQGFDLFVDDNGNPMLNENGLLRFIQSAKNIYIDSNKRLARIHEIFVSG